MTPRGLLWQTVPAGQPLPSHRMSSRRVVPCRLPRRAEEGVMMSVGIVVIALALMVAVGAAQQSTERTPAAKRRWRHDQPEYRDGRATRVATRHRRPDRRLDCGAYRASRLLGRRAVQTAPARRREQRSDRWSNPGRMSPPLESRTLYTPLFQAADDELAGCPDVRRAGQSRTVHVRQRAGEIQHLRPRDRFCDPADDLPIRSVAGLRGGGTECASRVMAATNSNLRAE
jgi:hypothetical protein